MSNSEQARFSRINFNLSHLSEIYQNIIMSKTGWVHRASYEIETQSNSLMNNELYMYFREYNGQTLLYNRAPLLNPEHYFMAWVHLHAFTLDTQYKILSIMKLSKADFELNYGDYNKIYIYVPYKDWYIKNLSNIESEGVENSTQEPKNLHEESRYIDVEQNITETTDKIEEPHWPQNNVLDSTLATRIAQQEAGVFIGENNDEQPAYNGSETETEDEYDPEEEFTMVNSQSKMLNDFAFDLNPKTQNSILLYRFQNMEKKDPSPWYLIPNSRPLYYSKTYNGYIVSLKYKTYLESLGAHNEICVEMEEVD